MSLYLAVMYGIEKGTIMKEFLMKMIPVSHSDRFPFHCRQCGECCRHVKESVPLESLDAFRLARYLRDRGEKIECMNDVLAKYTSPVLLHESGYTVFMLNTVGSNDSCVFLEGNKCTIHEVNPRACRTYPISAGPSNQGGYEQYLSIEQLHHFNGPQMSVKKRIQKRCSQQDYEFLNIDIGSAQEIAKLLSMIPLELRERALSYFLHYKYSEFDLDKSFVDQYRRNNDRLLSVLRKMAEHYEKEMNK